VPERDLRTIVLLSRKQRRVEETRLFLKSKKNEIGSGGGVVKSVKYPNSSRSTSGKKKELYDSQFGEPTVNEMGGGNLGGRPE